jgi:hypothetical protein
MITDDAERGIEHWCQDGHNRPEEVWSKELIPGLQETEVWADGISLWSCGFA